MQLLPWASRRIQRPAALAAAEQLDAAAIEVASCLSLASGGGSGGTPATGPAPAGTLSLRSYASWRTCASRYFSFPSTDGRECKVCMEKVIDTVAWPCRHSSMCSECMERVQADRRECPICRAPIDLVMRGHFATDTEDGFIDFGQYLVQATFLRCMHMGAVAVFSFSQNLSCILLISFMATLGSGGFTAWRYFEERELGTEKIFLTILVFACGYIPWFMVTVERFERRPERGAPFSWFRGQSRSPLLVIAKLLGVVFLGPVLCLVFFMPYFCIVLPLRVLLKWILLPLLECVLRFCIEFAYYIYCWVLRPIRMFVSWMCHAACRRAMRPVWNCLLTRILSPGRRSVHTVSRSCCAAGHSTCLAVETCISLCSNAMCACCNSCAQYTLVPIGNCLLSTCGCLAPVAKILTSPCRGLHHVWHVICDLTTLLCVCSGHVMRSIAVALCCETQEEDVSS